MKSTLRVLIIASCLCLTASVVACAYTWQTENVASGQYSSLVVDAAGHSRIAYYDVSSHSLKYSVSDGSNWSTVTVDSASNVGQHCSLALDSAGNANISYYDLLAGHLKCARFNGSTWTIFTVDATGNSGQFSSIALDNSGNPHIAYYDYDNGDLKYAVFNGSTWSKTVVDATGDVGQYCSLKLDSAGLPRISYYDYDNGDLKYAVFNGSTWSKTVVDAGGNVGQFCSLALDPAGRECISYYDYTNRDLKYAAKNGEAWATETLDSTGDVGQYTSLKLDKLGNPSISYFSFGAMQLRYAVKSGAAWSNFVVDSGSGYLTSLALDPAGCPRICYYASSSKALRYAYPAYPSGRLAPAKAGGDYVPFELQPMVVTGAFDGFFYVQTDPLLPGSGVCGIKVVMPGYGLAVDQRVVIQGALDTGADGERFLVPSGLTVAGTGHVAPLGIVNKYLGGSDWPAGRAPRTGQQGISRYGAVGLNNIGLLVTVWGRVRQVHPDGCYFYVDDGSFVVDGTVTDNMANLGVRVLADGRSLAGKYVSVTGISSCTSGSSGIISLVLVRNAADDIVQRH